MLLSCSHRLATLNIEHVALLPFSHAGLTPNVMALEKVSIASIMLGIDWIDDIETKVPCYLANRPEVESFRHHGFVLPDVESLRVQRFVVS